MEDFFEVVYRQKGKDPVTNQKHMHMEEAYEIIQTWTESGNVVIRDKIYPMGFGTIFFIYANDTHSTNPFRAEEYVRSKIVVSAPFLDGIARLGEFTDFIEENFRRCGGSYFILESEAANQLDGLFNDIARVNSAEGRFKKAEMISYLLRLLKATTVLETSIPSDADSRIVRVIDYINNNMEKTIPIDKLCSVANLSRHYLSHLFKRTVGMTVSQYVLYRRLAQARKYLLSTDMSVSEVAMNCGFSSFSYFSRIFKEEEGCSPREFRNRISE